MFNNKLAKVQAIPTNSAPPQFAEAAGENRGYQIGMADLDEIGVGYKGTDTICYIGTKEHPHLAPINPKFTFDNDELDRLITVAVNREWSREDYEPRRGVLLMGPTGAGKTTYLRQRFAMQGIPCIEMTWRPEMEAVDAIYTRELMGGDVILAPAALQIAALGGYPVVINEIDAARPGQLLALNEIIDTGMITIPETGEVIRAKRGFAVYATCNSSFTEDRSGAYSGTRGQNASVLNRFFKHVMSYADEAAEVKFIRNHFPSMTPDQARPYARFATLARKASDPMGPGYQSKGATHRLSLEFSRRNLLDWLYLTGAFSYLAERAIAPPFYALDPIYTAGLPDHEQATVKHLYEVAFGVTP